MGIIYCILNTKTNKAYIGQTIRELDARIKSHFKLLKSNKHYNNHLQNSYNKYGEEAFRYFILSEVKSKNLDKEEKRYILLYNTLSDKHGYNICEGGAGVISKEAQDKNRTSNQNKWPDVLQIDPKTLEVIAIYPSQNEAGKQNNIPVTHINQACNFKGGKRHGYHWVLETDYKNWKPPLQHRAKPYCLVDENNKIVDIFRSETEVEKRIKTSKTTIKKRCNTNTPLIINNKKFFIRSLTEKEYHSYNIGTCIDYPR